MQVAVYGTLKHGHNNHYLLETAKLKAVGKLKGWIMKDLHFYPAVIKDSENESEIHVEIYEINQATLNDLDRLEGYPSMYQREQVETEVGPTWIYFMDRIDLTTRKTIINGEW